MINAHEVEFERVTRRRQIVIGTGQEAIAQVNDEWGGAVLGEEDVQLRILAVREVSADE